VLLDRGLDGEDEQFVCELIERHVKLTHSAHAKRLLDDWNGTLAALWKVVPRATLSIVQAPAEAEPTKGVAD